MILVLICFWKRTCAAVDKLDINGPTLPRCRKVLRCLDDGSEQSFPETIEQHYQIVYFEALDIIISCVSDRFDQPGCKIYSKVQNLLLRAAKSEDYSEELQFVQTLYCSDFDPVQLSTHLKIFSNVFHQSKKVTLSDILLFFLCGDSSQIHLISQVRKLLMLLLVMPATNAQSERSFSAVRRI